MVIEFFWGRVVCPKLKHKDYKPLVSGLKTNCEICIKVSTKKALLLIMHEITMKQQVINILVFEFK